MLRRDFVILSKIVSEVDIALAMIDGVEFVKFESDEILKRAVCMTVINIGELVKSLSDDVRTQSRHIPWKAIAGFRDIAAHKYQTLLMEDVYSTVINDFPELKENIQNLIQ